MKNLKLILGIILLNICLTSCQKTEKLLGKWERVGDRFAGMKIQVIKEGESFKATIIETSDSCKFCGGFVIGDIKWKNIKNTEANNYEFEDLKKEEIGVGNFEPSYDLSYLKIFSESQLHTRGFSKGREVIGTEQNWRRISKE